MENTVLWASLGTSPMRKQKKRPTANYRQKQAVGAAQERQKCGFSGQIRHLPSLLCIWIIYPPQVHQPRAI